MTERRIIVVRADDPRLRDLGGFPTPALLDVCNDGKAHEAWANPMDDTVQWRLRDDVWDATHKPTDVPYVRVMAGLNPRFKEEW
ncbi:MAG: hypothetical protein RJA59_271 [Pseudomonadota bacterium]|jgi:hypothetical protein